MNTQRRAVIDIGTNSIKLLVADVGGRRVEPVLECNQQTRLGSGFYDTHQLQPDAIARTVRAVAEFAEEARRQRAVFTRVIATSATRDALNAGELTAAIEQITGHKVQIISGEQEADWVFLGVSSQPGFADRTLLILDVGGGSAEFILGENSAQYFRQSYRLGTVRLLELLKPADPPAATDLPRCRAWLADFLETQIQPALAPVLRAPERHGVQLIGTGGTPGILARMQLELADFDRARMEGARLTVEQIRCLTGRMWQLPLAARRQIVGLPPERADVILTGAAIYEAVLERFGFGELCISTRGLRFAAVMDVG